jgi:hypothetical protein
MSFITSLAVVIAIGPFDVLVVGVVCGFADLRICALWVRGVCCIRRLAVSRQTTAAWPAP